MPKLKHAFISSSIVRNLLKFNGKTEHLLPKEVQKIIGSMDFMYIAVEGIDTAGKSTQIAALE